MSEEVSLPFISIILPAKNEEAYVGRCLEALSKLDYPSQRYEVIVVDNGSDDKTGEIARSRGIPVLEKRGTISAVRNFGGREGKGSLLAFLDADCLPGPQWLRQAVGLLKEKPDVAVVGAVLELEERSRAPWIERRWLDYLNSKHKKGINYVVTISSFCFLVRRGVMEEVGWFNESLETCEDSDLGYRISQKGHKLIIDERIKTVHLRNAKTIKEFFLRQLWQGGSNLKNFFQHDFEWSELPSVLIPLLYFFLILALPFSFVMTSFPLLKVAIVALLLFFPLLIALKGRIPKDALSILSYTFIWFLYLLGRGLGVIMKISSSSK